MVVRLRDVAERAGVSVKTVSNVVNGYQHVSPRMRARVQTVLDELGYRPNMTARSLRRGRTGIIALAVPALDMPYFAELTRAVVEAAAIRGWTVLVDQTDGLAAREREVARGWHGNLIDGLVLSPMALDADELTRRQEDVPLVLLGERIAGGIDHVAVDNVEAARVATQHLVSHDRRRVAAIGYQDLAHSASGVAHLRRAGYEQALTAAGLQVDPALAPLVDGYRRADGAAAMAKLLALDEPPDAVFCFNDLLALGAMRALSEHGLSVPGDVAVVGFDDIEDARYNVPSLTTIAPATTAIAHTAVEMLEDRILGRTDVPTRNVRVDFSLAVRESTAGPPSQDTQRSASAPPLPPRRPPTHPLTEG